MSSMRTSRGRHLRSRRRWRTHPITKATSSASRRGAHEPSHFRYRHVGRACIRCLQGDLASPLGGWRRMIDTVRLTVEEALGLLEGAQLSAAELHRAYLDAIAERDEELHAYLTTVLEPEGDGVPIAFKDVISTRGVETTAGSKILAGYRPALDATVA